MSHPMCSPRAVAAILLALLVILGIAAPSSAQTEQPWRGDPGITETVAQISAREPHHLHPVVPEPHFRPPLGHAWGIGHGQGRGNGGPADEEESDADGPDRGLLPQNADSPLTSQWPPLEPDPNPPATFLPQGIGTTFPGAGLGEAPFIPPDTMGAVSSTQVLVFINGRIKVFDRNGNLGALNVSTDTFFNSVRNGSGTSDPRVIWDRLSQRWFLAMINVSTPNRILLAVSNSATITDSSSFTFFQFQQDLVGTTPNVDTGDLADYPSLGVDANALYIGANMFAGNSFAGTTGWVVRKSDLLANTLTVTVFRNLATAAGEGPYAPRGVTNDDPAATEGYFIGSSNSGFGRLTMRRISTPGGTPTISANILITVPATANPRNVSALGSSTAVNASDDRLYEARITRDRVSGQRTLWTAHAIAVDTAGVASTASTRRDAARWYQLGSLVTTPTLVQSGTLFDSAATNPAQFIYPSVVMTGQGHMALGCSSGGGAEHMQVSAAGRLASDPLGSTQARTILQTSSTSYTLNDGSGRNRWGDYSATMVDPLDDQSVWTFQEYCDNTNSWAVKVFRLLAPPPATPVSCSPSSIAAGAANVDVLVTGTSASGSAFYDTEPGFNRLAALFSGSGITVNTITFSHATPTQFTVNISVSAGAAGGARNLTVTNPDGQAAAGTGLLTITIPCTNPTITTNPTSQSACPGDSVTFNAAASGSPAPTYQWRKGGVNIGGATGASLAINPVVASSAGTYDCVATNTCGGTATATTTGAVLAVNSAPSIDTQPTAQTACVGSPASFTIAASGSPAPTLQWRKNTVNIGGATGTTLNIASVSAGDAANYDCIATNSCGSVPSNFVTLTVNTAPSIGTQPTAQTACTGSPASFTVAASGSPAPTLQWRKNTVPIGGATSPTLTIPSVSAGDAASYDCVATNTCSTATSTAASLTINTAPAITTAPTVQTACVASPASFTAAFSGSPTPTFQWRHNTVDIGGATGASLNIPSVSEADAGSYDCVATNACGSMTTTAVTLTVTTSPQFTTQPTDQTVCTGSPATFTIAASGSPTPSYQWRKNTIDISGATSATLNIPSPTAADAASYDCIATNSCGTATCTAAILTVRDATAITTQPTGVSTCIGGTATFTVAATGATTPTYQWRKATIDIAGATLPTLTITPVAQSDAASYDCVVTADCGTVNSTTVSLLINCPTLADVATQGGTAGCDGQVTVDDLVLFLARFFAGDLAVADVAGQGTGPGADGQVTVDDLTTFLSVFFAGCP